MQTEAGLDQLPWRLPTGKPSDVLIVWLKPHTHELYAFRKYLRQSHANQEPDKPQSLEGKDADSFLAEARLKAETPATTEPTVSTLQRANHANSTDTHTAQLRHTGGTGNWVHFQSSLVNAEKGLKCQVSPHDCTRTDLPFLVCQRPSVALHKTEGVFGGGTKNWTGMKMAAHWPIYIKNKKNKKGSHHLGPSLR